MGLTGYDVGGFIGITTLFFARAVGGNGQVITFEPNPMNYSKILDNIYLNGFKNAKVFQIAMGNKKEKAQLVFDKNNAGTGSIQDEIIFEGMQKKQSLIVDIEVDSCDNLIKQHNLAKPDFVKIDVEGFEMNVLSGMRETIKKYKPKLFIEIHGFDLRCKIENAREIIDFLINEGYSIYHVESEQTVDCTNAAIAKSGHIFCH